jgi:hypothetical protein
MSSLTSMYSSMLSAWHEIDRPVVHFGTLLTAGQTVSQRGNRSHTQPWLVPSL